MTAEQNNTLNEIAKQLDAFNATVSPEDKHSITNDAELTALVNQKKLMLGIFKKLAPLFETFVGKEVNPMELLSALGPGLQQANADGKLTEELNLIISWIPKEDKAG